MDPITYAIEAELESTHWWFVARRKLISSTIKELGVAHTAAVLDVGSGTGSNLRLLQELGFKNVTGVDNSDESIRFCLEKGWGRVKKGDVCQLPFAEKQFALILATDIIEHVDEDIIALNELKRVLTPNGSIIITVPAFHNLWGIQDEVGRHKRRYTLGELNIQIERTGLKVSEIFYFNYLLFVPIWLARKLMRIFGICPVSENNINTSLLNRILLILFTLDVRTARYIRPPFGVSILAISEKEN